MRIAGAVLTIDLDAMRENFRGLAKVCAPADTACVVKADAYGLGVERVVPALLKEGCSRFFVAFPAEGLAVRELAPDATIYVLNGLFSEEAAQVYAQARLVPVLNSIVDLSLWETFCGVSGQRYPCAVNVDTGMNRLGMTVVEALTFADENALTRALDPVLVMSHLACSDEPSHPMNRAQLESFQQVAAAFSGVETSLVNSGGVLLGPDYRFDVARPGIAVYGGAPVVGAKNPMRPVVTAQARISQIRYCKAGETVSYGASQTLERDSIIAIAAIGYGDGYPRSGSGSGTQRSAAGHPAASGFIAGRLVPVLGRITMDATMFDVTDLGQGAVSRGDFIELFGPNIALDDAAAAAGTIAYEMLTNLGGRYHRRYVGG